MSTLSGIVFNIAVNCQEENPSRYLSLVPSGFDADSRDDAQNYYKLNRRRSERVPAPVEQDEEQEDDYYQPQYRQKIENRHYRFQATKSPQKDYEEALKNNYSRFRVPKKQTQSNNVQIQNPTQSEQYLKEVNPTTRTAYERPQKPLGFNLQRNIKQVQNEQIDTIKPTYRYVVLLPDLQQENSHSINNEFESQEPVKRVPQPQRASRFNLVAHQNAQKRLLLAESTSVNGNEEEFLPRSPIYAPQPVPKPPKRQKPVVKQQVDNYEPTGRQFYPEPSEIRYQRPVVNQRSQYQNQETPNYPLEDQYQEQKEVKYEPSRTKSRTKTSRRKPRIQAQKSNVESYQAPALKYEQDDQDYYLASSTKYRNDQLYRAGAAEKVQEIPLSQGRDYYNPYNQQTYQTERARRPQYELEPTEYQQRSINRPRYQVPDLAYQASIDVPVKYTGNQPSVSYRQIYSKYPALHTKTRIINSRDNIIHLYSPEEFPLQFTQIFPKTTQIRDLPSKLRQNDYTVYPNDDYTKSTTLKRIKTAKLNKKNTYLNGQKFEEKIVSPSLQFQTPVHYNSKPQSSFNISEKEKKPFLILVYDD